VHEHLVAACDVGMTVWEATATHIVVVDANPAARRLLGRPLLPGEAADRVIQQPQLLLGLVEALADRTAVVVRDVEAAGRVVEARIHPLPDDRIGVVLLDVTAHHATGGRGARHDALTGLGNREEFVATLAAALEEAEAHDTRVAVVVLDLDRFKEVNDTLGHSQGDVLLAQVNRRLSSTALATRAVSRVGGDEFALLVEPRFESLEALAGRIASTFAAPFPIGKLAIRATASLGIAAWPDHGGSADDLLRKADVAMWTAKSSGRGVAVYRAEDDRYNLRRLTLQSDLRDAIDNGDLALHYQPKLDIATQRVVGAEALVRWAHPELGAVSPGEFVPIAEDSGLIGPLSHWVLDECARQLRAWQGVGIDIDVSANISTRNLYDPRLVRWLTDAFATHGIAPGQLTLELTETQMAEDLPMARQILRRLQAIGAELSIDDFGTGYSSLSYLSKLPLDELKIDRSFVLELENDHGAAVVQTIIGLGHELGLRVVAEGVESLAMLDTLDELGCDVVQGHHVSHALPADDFADWLTART